MNWNPKCPKNWIQKANEKWKAKESQRNKTKEEYKTEDKPENHKEQIRNTGDTGGPWEQTQKHVRTENRWTNKEWGNNNY